MSLSGYRDKILECLYNNASGLTITEISKLIDGNRNTVSKYLNRLKDDYLVYKKDIGKARVYFSKKRESVPMSLVISFMKAVLSGSKTKFPKEEQIFKEIGHIIAKQFQFPFGPTFAKELEKNRGSPDIEKHLRRFKKLYPTFDFLQEDLDIEIIELEQGKNKAIYRFKNSEFLHNSKDYIYYFYMICGIIEAILSEEIPGQVICNIESIKLDEIKENSYIDISIEIK